MNRSFATFALFALASAIPFATTGCIVGECDSGQEDCVQATSTIEYTGNKAEGEAAYEDGQGILIDSVLGDITVKTGGSKVSATFQPFTRNKDEPKGQENAENELANKLVLEVAPGDPVRVRIARKDGSTNFLGAHVTVTIPSSFNGDFDVRPGAGDANVNLGSASPSSTTIISDLGDITCLGATGPLNIQTDNGDVVVSVSTWAESGDGKILSGLGDVSVTVPADANGSISLYAPDETVTATFPADWTKAEAAANSVTYTMGDGEGAHVDVTAESLSSIRADAK